MEAPVPCRGFLNLVDAGSGRDEQSGPRRGWSAVGRLTMPEEINRLCTDAISDLLFTTDRFADANLLREEIDPRASILSAMS